MPSAAASSRATGAGRGHEPDLAHGSISTDRARPGIRGIGVASFGLARVVDEDDREALTECRRDAPHSGAAEGAATKSLTSVAPRRRRCQLGLVRRRRRGWPCRCPAVVSRWLGVLRCCADARPSSGIGADGRRPHECEHRPCGRRRCPSGQARPTHDQRRACRMMRPVGRLGRSARGGRACGHDHAARFVPSRTSALWSATPRPSLNPMSRHRACVAQ